MRIRKSRKTPSIGRRLATFSGTIVVYMGLSRLPQIAQVLIDEGKAPDTPSAVIQWGTLGTQTNRRSAIARVAGTSTLVGCDLTGIGGHRFGGVVAPTIDMV